MQALQDVLGEDKERAEQTHGPPARKATCLESALKWLWEKHEYLFPDEPRPDWSKLAQHGLGATSSRDTL